MKYLMTINHAESTRSETIPQGLLEAMGELVTDGFKSGWLKETAGLKPSAEGFRIRTSGGKLTQTDGPFTEAKELVGGFAIVEAASDQEARDLAWRFMDLHRIHWPEFVAECEVRPFEDM